MTALGLLVVLGLVFAAVWIYLARNKHPEAKLGPDGTNVREPETFVVHHEGKGQGLDIANTALKERTEHLRRDLPGDASKLHAPVPGRDMVRMDAPPSDVSRYGDEKVAPGATPGMPGAESKEKVLTEGPKGSRPETPEEPGSPYAMGRRVTDNHRDVELAADLLPNLESGTMDRSLAASPSTTGREPGYGLGATHPGETDGEDGPTAQRRGRVVQFRGRMGNRTEIDTNTDDEILFESDMDWEAEMAEDLDWSALHEPVSLPAHYEEDATVALVRTPRSLYVYWEKGGHGEENLQAMVGPETQTIPCLRVYDVTSGAFPGQEGGRTFTQDVGERDDHWFLNENIEPGHRYVVSYGRRTPDGRYYLLSHSATVAMPHDQPAQETQETMLYRMYMRQQPGGHHFPGSQWR